MNFNPFKSEPNSTAPKALDKISTVNELLANADVKKVLDSFITNDLDEADGLILIWSNKKHIFIEVGNMNVVEAVYALDLGHNELINKKNIS